MKKSFEFAISIPSDLSATFSATLEAYHRVCDQLELEIALAHARTLRAHCGAACLDCITSVSKETLTGSK